jgi:hypothetical protein
MKIAAFVLATCCLVQASVAARLGGRNLQGNDVLPWTGPNYDIGINGVNESKIINTAGSGDVLISMDISHEGSLETSGTSKDVLQVYFKVDNNSEQLWLDVVGEQYSSPAQRTIPSGSQLTIRVVGKTSFSNEIYHIRNFSVTEIAAAPVPAPTAPVPAPTAPAPAPVTAPVLEAPTSVGTCQVPWGGPDYEIGMSGLEKVETIDTSCVKLENVVISLDLSHLGTLEDSGSSKDTLQVYYKVDNNSEVLWLDIVGDRYSSSAQKTIASGSKLTFRVVGKTSFSNEFYQIKNLAVTMPTPVASPVPPPPTAPTTCGTPKVRI